MRINFSGRPLLKTPASGSYGSIAGIVELDGRVGAANETVSFYRRAFGDSSSSWSEIGSAITDADGGFSFTLPTSLSAGTYEYIALAGDAASGIITHVVGGTDGISTSSPVAIGGFTRRSEGMAIVPQLSESATSAANGAALEAAVASANTVGGYVKLPPGSFPMQADITTGCTVEFSPNTVFVQSENECTLNIDLTGDAAGPYSITGFTVETQPSSAGNATNRVLRVEMSVANTANFIIGDTFVVISADERTYYTTGDSNYAGEGFVVAHVDYVNGYVYVDGKSWLYGVGSLFTTTPSAIRLSRQSVTLINPQIEADDIDNVYDLDLTGNFPGSIEILGVSRLRIHGLKINSAYGAGLICRTTPLAVIEIDNIKDCIGDPSARYGYGILLRGMCYATRIHGGIIERTRHGITCDCIQTDTYDTDDWYQYGDCTDWVVDGVTCIANHASAFDTHENSINGLFSNCMAIGARYSQIVSATNGNGFNLRGPWDSVVNCQAIDCEYGCVVSATGIIHEIVGTNRVQGFRCWQEAVDNLSGYWIYVPGNASETTPQNVAITNLQPGLGSRGILIGANFTGKVLFAHSVLKGAFDIQLRIQGSCTVDLFNVLFDMTDMNSTEDCIAIDNSNTVSVRMVNCWVIAQSGTGPNPVAVMNCSTGATLNVWHSNCGDLGVNSVSLTTGGGTITPHLLATFTDTT